MKRVSQTRAIEELNLHSFGKKGWMKSEQCVCPKCQRFDKFGIKLDGGYGVVHCFHDDYVELLSIYLESIGRGDLLEEGSVFSLSSKLKKINIDIVKTELPEFQLPIGFREVDDDQYLNSRNFLLQHYNLFRPGYCDDPLLKNYIIYQDFQFGRRVGWQARSKYSKEWHKKNLENYKLKKSRLVLRYIDASGMDTSKILGGCDDITNQTEVLILVEGRFDKTGIDKKLSLYENNDIRCCFTFGNKISDSQVEIIRQFKSIKLIYLLYDEGTISQVKDISLKLSKYYCVQAAIMPSEEDPGDASANIILGAMESSVSAIEFFSGRIKSKL